MAQVVEQFVQNGFSEGSAIAKAELLGRCQAALGGSPPPLVFYVPGRIEILGKHTDYAGGRSLTCAVDRGFVVAVRPRSDSHVLAYACDLKQKAGFELTPEIRPPAAGWENYVMTVARRVARNFGEPLRGVDFAFASDLPSAGGMSSSSALVVATYLALNAANGLNERPVYQQNISTLEDLGGYLGTCENGQNFRKLVGDKGVGTFGGSEDHTAILCSKPGQLGLYTYNPVRLERRVDWPDEAAIIVGSSGVVAEKTAAAKEKYNRVSLLMSAIMETLRAQGWDKPTLAAAIGDDREAATCVQQILAKSRHPVFRPSELLVRFEQFAAEHQRIIPAAADAMATREWTNLSRLVEKSQVLAETGLGNQVPQTIHLTRSAAKLGAIAASAFGAGFGGSVWAMVAQSEVKPFIQQWQDDYVAAFPQNAPKATFFATAPVGGAARVV
jgi:galactokinase